MHASQRRRYRFRRRHTPHFYIVMTGVSAAFLVCVLYLVGYLTRSILLAELAFAAVTATVLIIFAAYFWGMYMLMSGHIPQRRLNVLLPHAGVGTLSPLLYTLNICFALDGLGTQPVSVWMLLISVICLALLGVQFAMGRALVRPEPLRVLTRGARAE